MIPNNTNAVAYAAGSVPSAQRQYVTIKESTGVVRQMTITITGLPIVVTDASAFASAQLLDFAEGAINILGVVSSIAWAVTTTRSSTINDSASLTWAVGTAAASNATLSSTMVDLTPKTTKVLSASGTIANAASAAILAAAALFDGTATAKDVFLNVGFETGTDIDGDGTLTATGTVVITYVFLGDK